MKQLITLSQNEQFPMFLEPCTLEHWDSLPSHGVNWTDQFIRTNLSSYLCPRKQDTIQIGGIFQSEHFKHLKVSVTECKNNTFLSENPWKPVCQTKEYFKDYFDKNKNTRVVFQFVNYIVNPPEPENYIRTFLDDSLFFTITPGVYVTADIYIQEYEFITDNSILPYKQIESKKLPIFENVTQPTLGDFFLRRDPITFTMNRQFVKISEVISYIGGFSQIFLSISAVMEFKILNNYIAFIIKLVSYHNEYIYSIRLANKLYNFELKQKKKKDKKSEKLKEQQQRQQNNTEFTIFDNSPTSPQKIFKNKKKMSLFSCEDSKKETYLDKNQNSCVNIGNSSKSKPDLHGQQEQVDVDIYKNRVQINEIIQKYNSDKINKQQIINQKPTLQRNSLSVNFQKINKVEEMVEQSNDKDKNYSKDYPVLKVNSMKINQDQDIPSQKQQQNNIIDQTNKTDKCNVLVFKDQDDSLSIGNDIAEERNDVNNIETLKTKQSHTQIEIQVQNKFKIDQNTNPSHTYIFSNQGEQFLSHDQLQFESNLPSQQFDNNIEQNQKNESGNQQQLQQNQLQLQQNDNQNITSFIDYQDKGCVINEAFEPNTERLDLIHGQSNVSYQDNQDTRLKYHTIESPIYIKNSNQSIQNGNQDEKKNKYLNTNGIQQFFAKSENLLSQSKIYNNPQIYSNKDIKEFSKSQIPPIEDLPTTTKRQEYLKKQFTTLLKREENLKITYQFFLYKLTCRKFFKTEQVLLLEKATKLVRKDLDVSLILYRLKELEKFKRLFLNENQEVLFNFFPKPIISIENQIELPSRLNIQQDLKKDKRRQKLSELSHIISSSLNSKVQKAFSVNSRTALNIAIAASKFKKPINSKLFEYNSMSAYQKLYEAYKNICDATNTTEFDKKLIMLLGEEVNLIFDQSERQYIFIWLYNIIQNILKKINYIPYQIVLLIEFKKNQQHKIILNQQSQELLKLLFTKNLQKTSEGLMKRYLNVIKNQVY